MLAAPVVCHSSPFCGQSPFRTFRQIFQPAFMVHVFVEMFEMEIVHKMGMSGTRLRCTDLRFHTHFIRCVKVRLFARHRVAFTVPVPHMHRTHIKPMGREHGWARASLDVCFQLAAVVWSHDTTPSTTGAIEKYN